MTLSEILNLCNVKEADLYDSYDSYQCCGIQVTDTVSINVTIDTDTHEVIEFEATTDSWSYPEEYESGNHIIRLEGSDLKYLPRALEFVTNPLDMTMNILESYIKEVRKFQTKFLSVLEENDWHCDFESCLGNYFSSQSIEPWFSFEHKYKERICFTFNVWKGTLSGLDADDINSLTIPQFRDMLYAFMKRFMLFDDEHEALVQSLKHRSSEVKQIFPN